MRLPVVNIQRRAGRGQVLAERSGSTNSISTLYQSWTPEAISSPVSHRGRVGHTVPLTPF